MRSWAPRALKSAGNVLLKKLLVNSYEHAKCYLILFTTRAKIGGFSEPRNSGMKEKEKC